MWGMHFFVISIGPKQLILKASKISFWVVSSIGPETPTPTLLISMSILSSFNKIYSRVSIIL